MLIKNSLTKYITEPNWIFTVQRKPKMRHISWWHSQYYPDKSDFFHPHMMISFNKFFNCYLSVFKKIVALVYSLLDHHLPIWMTYKSNNIHAAAIRDPKLNMKPAKNQILAPIGPRLPPSLVSPLTWLLDTAFIL